MEGLLRVITRDPKSICTGRYILCTITQCNESVSGRYSGFEKAVSKVKLSFDGL